jgi:hypothetical protein
MAAEQRSAPTNHCSWRTIRDTRTGQPKRQKYADCGSYSCKYSIAYKPDWEVDKAKGEEGDEESGPEKK